MALKSRSPRIGLERKSLFKDRRAVHEHIAKVESDKMLQELLAETTEEKEAQVRAAGGDDWLDYGQFECEVEKVVRRSRGPTQNPEPNGSPINALPKQSTSH